MALKYTTFGSEVMAHDDDKLILDHFISTEDRDDGGDVMRVDGCVIRGRPVVLKQHGLDGCFGNEPIAKPLEIRIGVNPETESKGLIARTQYYDGSKLNPPDNTGKRLYEKAKEGFMPNWSVGWQEIESRPTSSGGREVVKWSLHEYSQVAVGMNAFSSTPEYKTLKMEKIKEGTPFTHSKLAFRKMVR